jgi:hypothetical protein
MEGEGEPLPERIQIGPGKILDVYNEDLLPIVASVNTGMTKTKGAPVSGFTRDLAVEIMTLARRDEERQTSWVSLGAKLRDAFADDKALLMAHSDAIQRLIIFSMSDRKRQLLTGDISIPEKVRGVEDTPMVAKDREDKKKAQSFVANTWARVVKYAFPPPPVTGNAADRKRKGTFCPLPPPPTRPYLPPPSPSPRSREGAQGAVLPGEERPQHGGRRRRRWRRL